MITAKVIRLRLELEYLIRDENVMKYSFVMSGTLIDDLYFIIWYNEDNHEYVFHKPYETRIMSDGWVDEFVHFLKRIDYVDDFYRENFDVNSKSYIEQWM